MLSVVLPILFAGALAPVVWRVWRDRREERALQVRAAAKRPCGGRFMVNP